MFQRFGAPRCRHGTERLSDAGQIAAITAGSDTVVSAYAPTLNNTDELLAVTARVMDAVRKTGSRLVVVGEAASLERRPVTLLASGHLQPEWKPIATSHAHLLALLKNSDPLDLLQSGGVFRTRQ